MKQVYPVIFTQLNDEKNTVLIEVPDLEILTEGLGMADDDDKIRLNQRKPSKYKGLSRFGPEKTCNESTNL